MTEKLQKILADAGLGSRREIEKWISAGRVSVNQKIAKLGDRAERSDEIAVDDKPIRLTTDMTRLILLNKPEGYICTRKDDQDRPTVFELLPPLKRGRWVAVGRLDFNTSGLLLFTNNGELANKLMHPSANLEREYIVRVLGDVNQTVIDNLLEGVILEDGFAKFEDIEGPRGSGKNAWYTVVIKEGRKREVRRLWESQDCQVSRLKRVRFGEYVLPEELPLGEFIELSVGDYSKHSMSS